MSPFKRTIEKINSLLALKFFTGPPNHLYVPLAIDIKGMRVKSLTVA